MSMLVTVLSIIHIHAYMNRPITAPELKRSYNVYMSMKVLHQLVTGLCVAS